MDSFSLFSIDLVELPHLFEIWHRAWQWHCRALYNFKNIWILRDKLWLDKFSWDLSYRSIFYIATADWCHQREHVKEIIMIPSVRDVLIKFNHKILTMALCKDYKYLKYFFTMFLIILCMVHQTLVCIFIPLSIKQRWVTLMRKYHTAVRWHNMYSLIFPSIIWRHLFPAEWANISLKTKQNCLLLSDVTKPFTETVLDYL